MPAFVRIMKAEVSLVPILYLDVLVALNCLVDYLLLSLTARLSHSPFHRLRASLGALLGGVSACRILLSLPPLVSLFFHVATATLIVAVAFRPDGWRRAVRRIVTFYVASALLSGAVTALWYLTDSDVILAAGGVIYWAVSPLWLTVCTVAVYFGIRLYERLTSRTAPAAREYTVTVEDEAGECTCRALYDTGLRLREPFSGEPVIVVRRTELGMPRDVRLRMIPYRTVGGDGLLPAFRPHRVMLHELGTEPRDISGVYVALSDEPSGEYTALIGRDIAEY